MINPTQQLDANSQEEAGKLALIHAALDAIVGSGSVAAAQGATPSTIHEDGSFDPDTGDWKHFLRADIDPIDSAGLAP